MSKLPPSITTARDVDLRLSQQALLRAALRARELAVQTGTTLVVSRHGVIEQISPQPEVAAQAVQEPSAPYRKKP
jgi:hypothetical protein